MSTLSTPHLDDPPRSVIACDDSPRAASPLRKLLSQTLRATLGQSESPRVRLLLRNHLRKLCDARELPVQTKWGFRMLASPRDYASFGIYFFGEYDPRMSAVIRRYVQPGDTAWDLGAERGWFALLMASRVGPMGRVDAFEPFPVSAQRLQRNANLNGMHWLHTHEAAAGRSHTTGHFEPPSPDAADHEAFLDHCSGVGYLANAPADHRLEVPVLPLDEHADAINLKRLDFVKLDIEGGEPDALLGMTQTLKRHKPMLAVEYNRATLRRAGSSLQHLDDLLDRLGYNRFAYRHGRFTPVNLHEAADKPDTHAVFNVYAFHRHGHHRPQPR
ncbi:MAG: FkbM family methyltransferase [Planctomycetota bacterium]